MALSVSRGIYKFVRVETPQAVGGEQATGGAANLELSATFGPFVLSAAVHAQSAPAVGGLPIFPFWWSDYVRAERARQAARREALAVSGEAYVVALGPWAEADVVAEPARAGDLLAILKLPMVQAEVFVPRLAEVIHHAEPVDDEALALLAAALLAA